MKHLVELKNVLAGRDFAIIGIGNLDRADDGFGIAVAQSLKQDFPDRVFTELDGIDRVIHTIKSRSYIDMVVFVDTMDAGQVAGQIMIAEGDELAEDRISSHRIPLKLYGTLSEKPYVVLGIQPRNLDFGKPMSKEVQQGIKKVAATLSKLLK